MGAAFSRTLPPRLHANSSVRVRGGDTAGRLGFRSAMRCKIKGNRSTGGENQRADQDFQGEPMAFSSPLIAFGEILHCLDFDLK